MKKDVFIINNNKIIVGEFREIFGYYIFSYGAIFSFSYALEEELKYYKIISKEHCERCPIYIRIKLLIGINEWKNDEEKEKYTKIIWNEDTIKENKFNIYFTLGKNSVLPRYIFGERRDDRLEGIVIEELTGVIRGIEIINININFFDIIEPVIFQEDAWKIDRLNSKYYWTLIIPYEVRKTIDEIIEPLE